MDKAIPRFDNHDPRIRYYELLLQRNDLENLPAYPLPEGYRFVFYKPGERDTWIDIERSAKEFDSYDQGLDAWTRYYGEKVATATAFYDVTGRDTSGAGWLHWVAVKRSHQGKRLSKPLIRYVLQIMKRFGHTHAKIPTQTTTWLACKIYLDLGFLPIPQNAVNSRDGWRIIKALTDHPALAGLSAASIDEIMKDHENDRKTC